ncbi:hypothetical protein IE53DRAFT_60964 [Violaceomyces palustris]|uniref:Uncharacterized protein n=1 Tax=Violaceomyces palustris TaxID=1673888 RepID=A0ACD0NZ50_9BASI|nr:hypothetical protein IE53DRAFT_60964 [Violaceomyces palustris]
MMGKCVREKETDSLPFLFLSVPDMVTAGGWQNLPLELHMDNSPTKPRRRHGRLPLILGCDRWDGIGWEGRLMNHPSPPRRCLPFDSRRKFPPLPPHGTFGCLNHPGTEQGNWGKEKEMKGKEEKSRILGMSPREGWMGRNDLSFSILSPPKRSKSTINERPCNPSNPDVRGRDDGWNTYEWV